MEDQTSIPTPPFFDDFSVETSSIDFPSSCDKLNADREFVTKLYESPSTYSDDSTKSSNESKAQVAKDNATLSDLQRTSISRVKRDNDPSSSDHSLPLIDGRSTIASRLSDLESKELGKHNDFIIEGTIPRIVVTDSRESNATHAETPFHIKGASVKDISSDDVITIMRRNHYLLVPTVSMRQVLDIKKQDSCI